MPKLFTIGFTQKKAADFFGLLLKNEVKLVLDIRLNNTSQLAGFAKFPDIEYFLNRICNIKYIHDTFFSPEESTLEQYKKKRISWERYVEEFNNTMDERKIESYIREKYSNPDHFCLLCSEPSAEKCHRRLVANKFKEQLDDLEIIHL